MIQVKTLQDELDWAQKTLDIETSELPDILRNLQKEDFALENDAYEAVCLLKGINLKQEDRRYSVSRDLRQKVEDFASGFFTIEVDERKKYFDELWEKSKVYPEITPRLMELKKGLTVEPWKAKGNLANDLIVDLFKRPINKRSKKFFEILRFTPGQKKKILKDYNNLKTLHPDIAQLVPYFSTIVVQVKVPNKKAFAPVGHQNKQEEPASFNWAVVLLVIFGFKMLFLFGSSSNNSYEPVDTHQNYNNSGKINYQDFNNLNNKNDLEEILRKYRQNKPESNPANPPRPGYTPPSQPGYSPPSQPSFPSGAPSLPGFP